MTYFLKAPTHSFENGRCLCKTADLGLSLRHYQWHLWLCLNSIYDMCLVVATQSDFGLSLHPPSTNKNTFRRPDLRYLRNETPNFDLDSFHNRFFAVSNVNVCGSSHVFIAIENAFWIICVRVHTETLSRKQKNAEELIQIITIQINRWMHNALATFGTYSIICLAAAFNSRLIPWPILQQAIVTATTCMPSDWTMRPLRTSNPESTKKL